jgi:hypothetical protein
MSRAAVLLGVPVLLAAAVAVPLGWWRGPQHWLCAAVAVGLVVTPGLVTLVLAERLRRASAAGQVAALALGTAVRLLVGFGGAVLVFVLSKPAFHGEPFVFWLWILGVYLTTLVVETAILARPPSSRAATMRTSTGESA